MATSNCECERPVPVQRAERKGAAATYCAKCGRTLALRLGGAG